MPRFLPLLCALFIAGASLIVPHPTFNYPSAAQEVRSVTCTGVDDQVTINAAIVAAHDGDVIEIAPPGLCVVSSPILVSRSIMLQGTNGARLAGPYGQGGAALDLNADLPHAPVVEVQTGPTTLSGFQVSGGANAEMGGGIAVLPGVAVRLVDLDVTDNFASVGGGIGLQGGNGGSIIRNSRVVRNRALVDGGGIAIGCGSPGVLIDANQIAENLAGGNGGGLAAGGDACGSVELVLSNNLIELNRAESGGGLYLSAAHPAWRAFNNVVLRNAAMGLGGGFALGRPPLAAATGEAGAFFHNTVFRNTAEVGGGLWVGAPLRIFNDILWGNSPDDLLDEDVCPDVQFSVVGMLGTDRGRGCAVRGAGSTSLDPRLAEPNDGRIPDGSSASGIGAAVVAGIVAPDRDRDGRPRQAPIAAGAYAPPGASSEPSIDATPTTVVLPRPEASPVATVAEQTLIPSEPLATAAVSASPREPGASPTGLTEAGASPATTRTTLPTASATMTLRPTAIVFPTSQPNNPRPPGGGRRTPTRITG